MKNNYLIIPNSYGDAKKLSGNKLLLPLEFFSVGFNYYFSLSAIKLDNVYIYINRLLSSNELDKLSELLRINHEKISGIVFEDLGVCEIIKDYSFEKILFSSHILTNSKSINEYLEYVDSCVVSPDISLEEINSILNEAKKPLCLYGYGHLPLSYSRRTLNSNYANIYEIDKKQNLYLKNTDFEFIVNENEYGSVTYDMEVFQGLDENYSKDVKYFIINLFNIDAEDYLNKTIPTTDGFLYKKTIYKLKGAK